MDTPQPETAGETELSRVDAIDAAADAFKVHLGQVPERPRDESGRFVSTQEQPEEQIEAEAPEAEAESQTEEIAEEAAEEAQPEPVDLPPSWPSDKAEMWQSLDPSAQDFIVQREAEREAAVNAKFQEAANVRKANEATITEAQQSAQKFLKLTETAMQLIQPQWPSETMLIPGHNDYNPDAYHYYRAQAERAEANISEIQQRREEAVAQLTKEMEAKAKEEFDASEVKARPALLKDVPELSDPAKQPEVLNSLVQYAIQSGIPAETFSDPEQAKWVTSAQLHMAWKAQQYDKIKGAQGKVQPKAAKPAAPVVRPGVTTSKSQVKSIEAKNVRERLKSEGSIEAGAAFWKSTFSR